MVLWYMQLPERGLFHEATFLVFFSAILALASAHFASADAETTNKDVNIDISYDMVMDRSHPNPATNLRSHFHIQLVLSGKNKVSQTVDLTSAGNLDHRASSKALGAGAGGWHVASKNKLVRVVSMPQSVRTMIVTVEGESCNFAVTDVLKPGFSEYKFTASYTNWEFYNRYENVNPECKIH
jgi:hypothetical protein